VVWSTPLFSKSRTGSPAISHAQIAGEPVLDLLNKGVDQTTFKQSIASQTTQVLENHHVRQ
jgi:L-lactate dehydrogenase